VHLTHFQIHSAAANSNCRYPDHSIPACVSGNSCEFSCTDGFTAFPPNNPTTCICEAPSVVCNGQCVAAGSCPSSVPSKKKRWVGSGSCAEMGYEWSACGVFGGRARAWECINTARDLESCKCLPWQYMYLCQGRVRLTMGLASPRWWMRAASDALHSDWPGLHFHPWCCGRLVSGW
jgi:hypothetical protein